MTLDTPPTLLLADDDAPSLTLLSRCLRDAGYATIECEPGRDALQQAIKLRPDLAVLDINMPDMSGTDFARQLQSEVDIPFIFLSAHDESAFVNQAVAAGALGYLVKPVEATRIVPTVRAALSRAEEMRRLRPRPCLREFNAINRGEGPWHAGRNHSPAHHDSLH